jgi:hypothetical protein
MKNDHEIRGNVTALLIHRKDGTTMEALIDTDQADVVGRYRWNVMRGKHGAFYVMANLPHKERQEVSQILLHRLIMDAPKGVFVDHIDHNPLNNTRANLRLASNGQNMQNLTRATKRSASGVLNVFWYKAYKKWEACIVVNKKSVKLGYFDDIREAEAVVKRARAILMPYSQEAMARQAAL